MPETTQGTTRVITFGHLEIEYDERVLEPRPWTARQSAWAAELLAGLPAGDVLELCAGAGHIGLLAVARTGRRLVQVDADETACGFARLNAARAGVPVEVRHGWLEEALSSEERFVLVIADPPWVPSADTTHHPADPLTAIDGGTDGLDVVRSSLAVIGRHLAPGGAALLQVGNSGQAEGVAAYVEQTPSLGLRAVDHRTYQDGAVVHLTRRD